MVSINHKEGILTIREEPPQHSILLCILTARQRSSLARVPTGFSHHGTPHIAYLHASVLADLPHSFCVSCRCLSCTSQAVVAWDVGTVVGTQHALVDRRRRDEDDTKVRSAGEVSVREDGVEVGGEVFKGNVLLRTAWSVWEARVIGT